MNSKVRLLGGFNILHQEILEACYKSLREVELELNINRRAIVRSTKDDNVKTCGFAGYKWKWFDFDNQDFYECLKDVEENSHKNSILVAQNDEGQVIYYFRIYDAKPDFYYGGIQHSIRTGKQYGGFHWSYKDIDKKKLIEIYNTKYHEL